MIAHTHQATLDQVHPDLHPEVLSEFRGELQRRYAPELTLIQSCALFRRARCPGDDLSRTETRYAELAERIQTRLP